jgi:hypothetical protein
VTTNVKRLALGVALAGIVSGGAAASASALEGQAYAPIAGDCGGSVYWNTSSSPILTASVNHPDGCTDPVIDRVQDLLVAPCCPASKYVEAVKDIFAPPVP